ncbi:hypothetical protein ACFSM5_21015 [Lacibacterium aquatile]|uniref:Cytochrome-c oxidase n=1 Tax=Lacibacterium aquatile TaxID=1168082 RepID=A0ABW5DWC9_9PROT
MNRYAAFHLRLASLYAIVGMALGIYMGINQNFTLMSAHVHLNLLGWVSITLYGLVLRLDPYLDGPLPMIQTFCAHIGALGMFTGLTVMGLYGHEAADPFLIGGSLSMITGALLFALMVFRITRR